MNRTLFLLAASAVLSACAPTPPAEAPAPAAPATPAAPAAVAPPAEFPTTAPQPGPTPELKLPDPVERRLANGLRVLYVRQPELPVVAASLVIPGGNADEPAALPGIASFTANMLDEGAAGRSALEIADALDLLGASLTTTSGWDAAQASLYVLRPNFPQALQILADVVVRPDFPEREVSRLREERLTELARAKDNPGTIAGNAFQSLVYGAKHPYGRFASTESARRYDRAALTRFHRAFYRPQGSTLILVGDVDPQALHPAVERAFVGWRGSPPAQAAAPAPASDTPATAIYLVDKPGAAQSEIRIGHPGVARDNPDFFALTVLNTLLGGSFTSRLNANLREAHGYTYGARSSFAMRRGAGPFTAEAAVTTAKTDSALIEFFRELNRIRTEPVPRDELERAKRFVALGLPRRFETAPDVAARLAELAIYGLDMDFYDEYVDRIMAVTGEDVRRVANQYVRPGRSVVVVVGDRKTVEAGVRAAGLGPVQVREIGEFVR
jgi:zinc protease